MNKIIHWGEEYVHETNSSTCPLCKSKFATMENLIANIKIDKNDVLKINELSKEISKYNENIKTLNQDKKELIGNIITIISHEKENISKSLSVIQKDKDELVNQRNDLKNSINIAIQELKDIDSFFGTLTDDPEIRDEKWIEKLKKDVQSEISCLFKKDERLDIIMKTKEERLIQKEDDLLSEESQINKNFNSIKLIESKEVFKTVTSLLKKYNLVNEQLNTSLIGDFINDFKAQQMTENNLFNKITVEKQQLLQALEQDEIKIEETDLNGKIQEIKSAIETQTVTKESFESKYRKHFPTNQIKETTISQKQFDSDKLLDELTSVKNDLDSLGIDLELIKENIEKNEIEKNLIELHKSLPQTKKSFNKIDLAQKACIEFIQSGIDNYFNKVVINEIYGRIEPHPKLKRIDFKAEISDSGVPRLLITAGNDTDKVNPVLFLSAGQVNVLSLSIFLAKAFELGSETISTIFMDDPIQNLSDINVLSFIDLLRTLIAQHDKQIVLSTHDEKFFRLLQNKLPEEYCNSKYLEFESEGKLK